MKIHGRGRRLAAVLAFCVASAVTFTSCSATGGDNNSGSTPATSGAHSQAAPSPAATAAEKPQSVAQALEGHPTATSDDLPYEMIPRVGDDPIPGLQADTPKGCILEGYDANMVMLGDVSGHSKRVVYNGGDGDVVIEATKGPDGLIVNISPNHAFYGGWYNDDTAFLIPFTDSDMEFFVESVVFPVEKNGAKVWGEAKTFTLCAVGEKKP